MRNHATQTTNLLKVLAGSAFVLSAWVGQAAIAQTATTNSDFSNASLEGTYVYLNNSSDVASFGPMTFDGQGGVNAALEISLPCETPSPYCARRVVHSSGRGTYSVNPDGTGMATIDLSTGKIVYSFIISESTTVTGQSVATKVSAVGHNGGLAGQIVAPTWIRRAN